jgi:threonine aldolase
VANDPVDLRSDTVTRPTAGMRAAMAAADVGDDVYGEDPTAARLEARVAELLGKEAALFVPSGTMANQIALLLHCRPGDEVIVGAGTHCMEYESGGAAAWAGVQFAVVGEDGTFDAETVRAAIRPAADWLPRSALVVLENTHNRGGGRVFPQAAAEAIGAAARAAGLRVHLDGARLWNASAATGVDVATLAAPADTVSVCFSKGLGAPVGSALAGPLDLVREARRLRKRMGGGMRQVGVLCAAALHALDHHRARLGEDHRNARLLAERLASVPGCVVDPAAVETNIVLVDTRRPAVEVAARAAREGVLLSVFGPHRLRAVTHLDVDRAGILRAVEVLARAL